MSHTELRKVFASFVLSKQFTESQKTWEIDERLISRNLSHSSEILYPNGDQP